eukprot:758263-Hanusia_phi.AAC.1
MKGRGCWKGMRTREFSESVMASGVNDSLSVTRLFLYSCKAETFIHETLQDLHMNMNYETNSVLFGMSDEGIRSGEVIGELCNVLTQFHQKVHANFNCCVWHAHEFLLDSANSNVIVADSLNGSLHGAYRWRPRSCTSHDWLMQLLSSSSALQSSRDQPLHSLLQPGHSIPSHCNSCMSLKHQQLQNEKTISELNEKLLQAENDRHRCQESLARVEEEKLAVMKEVSLLKSKILSDSKPKATSAPKSHEHPKQDVSASMGDWQNLRREAELVINGRKHEHPHQEADPIRELNMTMETMKAEHSKRIYDLQLQQEENEKQVKSVVKYAIRLCTDAARCNKDSLAALRSVVNELIPDDYDNMYFGNLVNSGVHLQNVEMWSRSKSLISQVVSYTIEESLVSLLKPSEELDSAPSKKFLYPQAEAASSQDPSFSLGLQSVEITAPSGFAAARALDGGWRVNKPDGRKTQPAVAPMQFHLTEGAMLEDMRERREMAVPSKKFPPPASSDVSLRPYDPSTSWRGSNPQQESSSHHPSRGDRSFDEIATPSRPVSSQLGSITEEKAARTSDRRELSRAIGKRGSQGDDVAVGSGASASTAQQIMKALSSGKKITVKTQQAAGYDDLTLL